MTGVSQAKKEKRIPGRGRQEGRPWGGKGFKKLDSRPVQGTDSDLGGDRHARQGQRGELGPDHHAGPYEPFASVNSKFSCIWPKHKITAAQRKQKDISLTLQGTPQISRSGLWGHHRSLAFRTRLPSVFYSAIKHVASVWQASAPRRLLEFQLSHMYRQEEGGMEGRPKGCPKLAFF